MCERESEREITVFIHTNARAPHFEYTYKFILPMKLVIIFQEGESFMIFVVIVFFYEFITNEQCRIESHDI